jgi:hypothetical protein
MDTWRHREWLGIRAGFYALRQHAWTSGLGALLLVGVVIANSVSILTPAARGERPAVLTTPTPTARLVAPATTPTSQAIRD